MAEILNLAPESHDKKIEELLAIAEGNGVLNAVSVVRGLKDPPFGRRFAPSLDPVLYPRRYFQAENKKPLSQALDMVLYEISLPRERRRKKRKNFKEFISAMEQFYSGMMILNQDKEECFALEIGLPVIGEEIVFYAAVPESQKLFAGKADQRLVCQCQN